MHSRHGRLRRGARGADRRPRRGCHVYDQHGRRYFDGLSALFCVNVGHGRAELAQAGADQARELGFFTTGLPRIRPRSTSPPRIASLAPGDLNRVFVTSGGSEAVESALKLCRQYHKLTGAPGALQGHLARWPTTARRWAPHRHGHPRRARAVRAAVPRVRARGEHERPLPARDQRPRRGDPRADRVRGPGDRVVRDPRARAELGRLPRPAPRATSSGCARSATIRRPLHLRRGDLLVGSGSASGSARSATAYEPTSSPRRWASLPRTRRWGR
jgi:hypothetical protein